MMPNGVDFSFLFFYFLSNFMDTVVQGAQGAGAAAAGRSGGA